MPRLRRKKGNTTMSSKPTRRPGRGGRAGMKKELPEHFKAYKHVWVFVELERGAVHPVSWELMGEGRKLADKLGVQLAAVVLGGPGEAAKLRFRTAFAYGADVAYVAASPVLERLPQRILHAVHDRAGQHLQARDPASRRDDARPRPRGLCRDNAAHRPDRRLHRPRGGCRRIARRDAPDLRRQPAVHDLHAQFPAADGDRAPARHSACPSARKAASGPVIEYNFGLLEDDIVTKILQFIPDRDSNKSNLAYADVVVAGGLGLAARRTISSSKTSPTRSARNGADRARSSSAAGSPADRQIGQTGKTIRPKLYIAAGISGAIQHRVGVEGADLILAINTDKNAPIFDFAHVGIVTDAVRLLPALAKAFRQRISPSTHVRMAV